MKFEDKIQQFMVQLDQEELEQGTKDKYKKNIIAYIDMFKIQDIEEITKDNLIKYKSYLEANYKPATINNKLIIINKFLKFVDLQKYTLKLIRVQRKTNLENAMSNVDYERVIRFAKRLNKNKMLLIIRTLAETGIRIEELKYITVEAVKKGTEQVYNKKKIRTIIINKALCKNLKKYCKEKGITKGIIFHGRNKDKALSKSYIWQELQYISGQARVNKKKAHAHSMRHLFAKEYLKQNNNDIFTLADLLGHTSLETVKIYAKRSLAEQRKSLVNMYK